MKKVILFIFCLFVFLSNVSFSMVDEWSEPTAVLENEKNISPDKTKMVEYKCLRYNKIRCSEEPVDGCWHVQCDLNLVFLKEKKKEPVYIMGASYNDSVNYDFVHESIYAPIWSPDSRYFVFFDSYSGTRSINLYDTKTGKNTEIFGIVGFFVKLDKKGNVILEEYVEFQKDKIKYYIYDYNKEVTSDDNGNIITDIEVGYFDYNGDIVSGNKFVKGKLPNYSE